MIYDRKATPAPPEFTHLYWCPGCGHSSTSQILGRTHFGVRCDGVPVLLHYVLNARSTETAREALRLYDPEAPVPESLREIPDFDEDEVE